MAQELGADPKVHIKVSGNMTRCMDMGNLHGRMVECTMDNITMGTRKALVYSNGQMEKATKGNGVMGRCMGQGSSKTHVIT